MCRSKLETVTRSLSAHCGPYISLYARKHQNCGRTNSPMRFKNNLLHERNKSASEEQQNKGKKKKQHRVQTPWKDAPWETTRPINCKSWNFQRKLANYFRLDSRLWCKLRSLGYRSTHSQGRRRTAAQRPLLLHRRRDSQEPESCYVSGNFIILVSDLIRKCWLNTPALG